MYVIWIASTYFSRWLRDTINLLYRKYTVVDNVCDEADALSLKICLD